MARPKPHRPRPAAGAPLATPHRASIFERYSELGVIVIPFYIFARLYRGDDCFDEACCLCLGLLTNLLFSLLRFSERAPPRSDERRRLKLACWAVHTALIFGGNWYVMRSLGVLTPMSPRHQAQVWAVPVAASAVLLHRYTRRD